MKEVKINKFSFVVCNRFSFINSEFNSLIVFVFELWLRWNSSSCAACAHQF